MHLTDNSTLQNGKYKILKTIGQGGFGITYLAQQVIIDRPVCIKELLLDDRVKTSTVGGPQNSSNLASEITDSDICNAFTDHSDIVEENNTLCQNPEPDAFLSGFGGDSTGCIDYFSMNKDLDDGTLVGRPTSGNLSSQKALFLEEAKMLSTLNHQHIVSIFDAFEEGGSVFYVMELIDGVSLSEILKNGVLPEAKCLEYIEQIADALDCVHRHGILHLDIKPSNIMIENRTGRAVLIDFGVSRSLESLGKSPAIIGRTQGYAPIEMYQNCYSGQLSPRTDIYSLGATLYNLLTGKTLLPADQRSGKETLEMDNSITGTTRTAIRASTELYPENRPENITAFLEMLHGKSCLKQFVPFYDYQFTPKILLKDFKAFMTFGQRKCDFNCEFFIFGLREQCVAFCLEILTKQRTPYLENGKPLRRFFTITPNGHYCRTKAEKISITAEQPVFGSNTELKARLRAFYCHNRDLQDEIFTSPIFDIVF